MERPGCEQGFGAGLSGSRFMGVTETAPEHQDCVAGELWLLMQGRATWMAPMWA